MKGKAMKKTTKTALGCIGLLVAGGIVGNATAAPQAPESCTEALAHGDNVLEAYRAIVDLHREANGEDDPVRIDQLADDMQMIYVSNLEPSTNAYHRTSRECESH